jgi:hypothetical protein
LGIFITNTNLLKKTLNANEGKVIQAQTASGSRCAKQEKVKQEAQTSTSLVNTSTQRSGSKSTTRAS